MSETSTQMKVLAIGDKVAGRYEVTQALPQSHGRAEYAAKDTQEQGTAVVLTQVGKPTKESEPDKVKRGLERAQRVASWIRTPGAVVPRDFLYDEGCLYSVSAPAQGMPLPQYIKENAPPLNKMVGWITDLAGVLGVFHDARQPQFLGGIPLENLQVTAEGQLQLVGFDMGPDFKLDFHSENPETPKAPDQRLDARSDIWALGSLLQRMVDASADDVKKALKAETDLRSLLLLVTNQDAEKRLPNMATLKTRFERISWSKAPKLSNTSVIDAPIKVLTVEEKSPLADIVEAYRLWIGLSVVGILLLIAVLQFIFPPEL